VVKMHIKQSKETIEKEKAKEEMVLAFRARKK